MNCWPPKFRKKSALIDKANDALKLVEQIAHPLANTRVNIKKVIIERESFYKIKLNKSLTQIVAQIFSCYFSPSHAHPLANTRGNKKKEAIIERGIFL